MQKWISCKSNSSNLNSYWEKLLLALYLYNVLYFALKRSSFYYSAGQCTNYLTMLKLVTNNLQSLINKLLILDVRIKHQSPQIDYHLSLNLISHSYHSSHLLPLFQFSWLGAVSFTCVDVVVVTAASYPISFVATSHAVVAVCFCKRQSYVFQKKTGFSTKLHVQNKYLYKW